MQDPNITPDNTEGKTFWQWLFWKKRGFPYHLIIVHAILGFGCYELITYEYEEKTFWTYYFVWIFIAIVLTATWAREVVLYRDNKPHKR